MAVARELTPPLWNESLRIGEGRGRRCGPRSRFQDPGKSLFLIRKPTRPPLRRHREAGASPGPEEALSEARAGAVSSVREKRREAERRCRVPTTTPGNRGRGVEARAARRMTLPAESGRSPRSGAPEKPGREWSAPDPKTPQHSAGFEHRGIQALITRQSHWQVRAFPVGPDGTLRLTLIGHLEVT